MPRELYKRASASKDHLPSFPVPEDKIKARSEKGQCYTSCCTVHTLFRCLFFCKECRDPLGMESRAISDAQISASSEWNPYHAAIQGRLNFQAGGGKSGSWSARYNDQNQWLQADLGSSKVVTSLATQGRNGYGQWVTSYKVEYKNDGSPFQSYQEQGVDKVCELFYTSLLHTY